MKLQSIPSRTVATAIAAMTLLSSCGSLDRINANVQRNQDAYDVGTQQTADLRAMRPQTVRVQSQPWVSTTPIARTTREDYPPVLQCPISLARQDSISIYEFAQIVTDECGVPVRVTPDAKAALSGSQPSAAGMSAPTAQMSIPIARPASPNMLAPPLPSQASQPINLPSAGNGSISPYIGGISWTGKPLSGLLDSVTSRLGLSWAYRDNAVYIYYTDTRVFRIYAIPSKTSMEYMVQSGKLSGSEGSSSGGGSGMPGGSGGNSGSSGGSNQTTKVSIEASLTEDMRKTLEAMVTPGVGRVALGANSATVTDTPASLSRIAEYLERENRHITRQALFNVTVASVTLTDTDGLGLDLGLVYKALSGNYGINLANAFSGVSDGATASVGVLEGATGGAARFAGSRAILQALAGQGRVSVLTQPSVTTLNLQPVPVQIARQTSYLESVSTTNTAQVGSTATLTPGTVTTGFSMDLLPYMMEGDEMLLQFTMNLSPDARFRVAESGDNRIEVPEIDSRIFSQRVKMRSGQTLILSGFEQQVDASNKSGVGSPSNWIFGGSGSSDRRREVIVILITPVIFDETGTGAAA